MGQETRDDVGTPYPGNVLVAGTGFIVTGAGWGLFGYFEGDFGATTDAGIYFGLALLHILTGALVLSRQRVAVPIGLALAIVGLVVAALQSQYVLVFTNLVIFVLLILARSHVIAGRGTA